MKKIERTIQWLGKLRCVKLIRNTDCAKSISKGIFQLQFKEYTTTTTIKVRKLSFFVEVWIVKKVGNPLLSGFEKIILDVVDNNNATVQLHLKDPFPPWWFLLSFYSRKRRDPRLCNNKAPMGFNSPVCTAATYRLVWLHRV